MYLYIRVCTLCTCTCLIIRVSIYISLEGAQYVLSISCLLLISGIIGERGRDCEEGERVRERGGKRGGGEV